MFLPSLNQKITDFIQNNSQNFVRELDQMQIYNTPLIAVADASDPLWQQLKKPAIVGPDHLMPSEWLSDAKSVISYFLPFTESVRVSNREKGTPSAQWLYGRYEGELFNNTLRSFIIDEVENFGGKAIAPALDERYTIKNRVSNWSERHAAFIAGLGTFSWSHALITPLGTAGRVGSVISDLELEPTVRPYEKIDEYCNKCGDCIKRCPAQAITENHMDKERCSNFLDKILKRNHPRYGCGKCQTHVSCEYEKASH